MHDRVLVVAGLVVAGDEDAEDDEDDNDEEDEDEDEDETPLVLEPREVVDIGVGVEEPVMVPNRNNGHAVPDMTVDMSSAELMTEASLAEAPILHAPALEAVDVVAFWPWANE